MEAQVQAAFIAAAVALPSALVTAYLTVWSGHRQRATDFVVAALSHMGGGTQERSAGVAALMAMRGPINRRPRMLERGVWARQGPAVGQQIYRQAVYILYNGRRGYYAHEAENVLEMLDWLLMDDSLGFRSSEHGDRLTAAMSSYKAGAEAAKPSESSELSPKSVSKAAVGSDASVAKLLVKIDEWTSLINVEK